MQKIEEFFSKIEDQKAVRVALPIRDQNLKERYQCIYSTGTPPSFSLVFPEEALPFERLDRETACLVTVDIGGQAVSITAFIESSPDNQTLVLTAKNVADHEQQRNYFRVDASTPISASPLIPKTIQKDAEEWHLEGETVDLSGSGALCTFPQPIEINKRVRIDLALPTGYMEVISIIGHVVRCRQIDGKTYQVGLHFDALTSEDRDRIMASCFELQRKHLRMKVQVKDRA